MSSLTSKGYTPCEYIESSGTQYIDTGFKPNQNTRVVMDVQILQNNSSVAANELYGARTSTSSKCFAAQYNYETQYLQFFYGNGFTQVKSGLPSNRDLCVINKNIMTFGGQQISRSSATFQCDYNLYLLALNNAGAVAFQSIARLYSCQVYDNGTLIRDFKPCRNTSGVYGLFDEVNDVFYTTPSGSFTGNVAETSIKLSQSFRRRLLISSTKVEVDYEKQYLTIESLGSGNIGVSSGVTYYYSKNGGAWVSGNTGASITVVSGDKVRFKATCTADEQPTRFSVTAKFNVYGNIMSLIHGDGFVGNNTLFEYAFYELFESSLVVDASNLILPATTLAESCYDSMFSRCASLTAAPELPATTLADYCYYYMFLNCTSLTTAPELPATTLARGCYADMFAGCTSLTTAPKLPATTLTNNCYYYMFSRCESLTSAPELPATKLANNCYAWMLQRCPNLSHITMLATDISAVNCLEEWVYDVASSGTFVKHPNMTSLPTGKHGIPSGWTVVNSDGSPVTGGGDSGGSGESTPVSIDWTVQEGNWTEGANSSAIDGKQFTSVSPGGDGSTRLRCTFSGVTSITFNCVYNGESNYDYLTVGDLDSTCTRYSYGTTLKGTSGTAKDITFSCDSGTHYVEFCYSKDSNVDTQPDCAVVYIKNWS